MKKTIKKTVGIAFWLIIWLIASLVINKELILPTPWMVLSHLFVLVREGSFWLKCLYSMLRVAGGFLLGLGLGIVLAILERKQEWLEVIITPFIHAVSSIPVASFIVLVMLWVKTDLVPMFIASLIVLPIVYSNTKSGIENVDIKMIEVGKVFRFSKKKMLRYIWIPEVSLTLIPAALNAFGLAWKSGIAAEVLSLPKYSIGSEIYNSKIYLETADLFAWTLVVVCLSFLIERLLKRVANSSKEDSTWK